MLVVAVLSAGFEHGGLRHVHGPPDGPGAEHISYVVCAQGTRGRGLQPEISHELSQTICRGGPATGAIMLSHRRAGGLSPENFLNQLAGARPETVRVHLPCRPARRVEYLDFGAARHGGVAARLRTGPIFDGALGIA